jgi:outer membrane autotransporter protein
MKKTLLSLFVTTAVASTGAVASHVAPYVGLALGGINSHHKVDTTVTGTNKHSFNLSKQTFAGELLAGAMFTVAPAWKLGLELNYSVTSNEPDAYVNRDGSNADRLRIKSNWALGAGVRLGYMVSNSTLMYVRAGIEHRKFSTSFTATTGTANNIYQSTSKTAFAPAIGFEVDLTPHWAIGGEFRTAYYGNIAHRGTVSEVSYKPRTDTYFLNLKYKFNPLHNHSH